MITVQWTKRNGEIRNTTFKPSTASKFIMMLEAHGFEWKIIVDEGEVVALYPSANIFAKSVQTL